MRQKIQYSLALEPVDQGETPVSGYHCKNRSKPAPDFGRKRQVISAESGT